MGVRWTVGAINKPTWCNRKDCSPLHNTSQCCIGVPEKPVEHDGTLNDMCLCVDDGISWYVNTLDLRVLRRLLNSVLDDKYLAVKIGMGQTELIDLGSFEKYI